MGTSLLLFGLLLLVIFPIWTFVQISGLRSELHRWKEHVNALDAEIRALRARLQQASPQPPIAPAAVETRPTTAPAAPLVPAAHPVVTAPVVTESSRRPTSPTPAAPPVPPTATVPLPPILHTPTPAPAAERRPVINFEQFVGAKLLAWIGGFAAFLAVGFFVKYSFEHELIPPEVRVAIGFLLGAALIVAGLWIKADRLRVTAHVLSATGVVSLYAVTFASHAVYHFAFFTTGATFALMALITATAFLLAVRQQAHVVALLGLLGGFLTPALLSTGQDNPAGLFGYIALLDLGLIAVALHQRWHYLVALAAGGTVLVQLGWMNAFFAAPRAPLAMGLCLGFSGLFAGAAELSRRWRVSGFVTWPAVVLPFVALGYAAYFLTFPSISERAVLLFAYVFAADGLLLALTWRDELARRVHLGAAGVVFLLLVAWTSARLTDSLLAPALAAYLIFACLHTAFPLLLDRKHPGAGLMASQFFPPLALGLMLVPLFKLTSVSLLFWPSVLLVDIVAVGLALISASLPALAVVLVLTCAATAVAILQMPVAAPATAMLFVVIAGGALFFVGAGLLVMRRLGAATARTFGTGMTGAAGIPAFATLLPFVLLMMMSQRLAFPNPGPLFGLGLLLVVLALGLSRLLALVWLPACALVGISLLQYGWHPQHFKVAAATVPLAWYVGFHLLFAVYPFVFRRGFAGFTGPWAVAALSGVIAFPLVHQVVRAAWPDTAMGLLGAGFALPPLLSLVLVVRSADSTGAARLNQIAWFAGVALFFITLIFPLQFERQWITLSWALEGVALLWLFRRVPHLGLRATGVGLLVVAFARLAVNPAVLHYHPRSDTALLNWYLYTYGLVTVALFVGARLVRSSGPAPVSDPVRVLGIPAAATLSALGAVLAFLLLNIEIADYFSGPGSTLTFQFSGSFARDMTYTVSWALYALVVLGAGIWRRARLARLAAIALLGAALLKLFFHDLAQLGQLYRVGALVGVAAVAIIASFLYQRFVPADEGGIDHA